MDDTVPKGLGVLKKFVETENGWLLKVISMAYNYYSSSKRVLLWIYKTLCFVR